MSECPARIALEKTLALYCEEEKEEEYIKMRE